MADAFPRRVDRRGFLVLGGSALVAAPFLASCSSDGDTAATGTSTSGTAHEHDLPSGPATGTASMVAVFDPNAYAVTGNEQRLPLAVLAEDGSIDPAGPESIEFQVRRDGEAIGERITVARHNEGVPIGFYPLRTTFPEAGTYSIEATLDGQLVSQAVTVSEPSSQPLLVVGGTLPSLPTPTTTDAQNVDPICTQITGPCPLHDETLEQVLDSGRPMALLVSTPAYCQIGVCGPVLDILLDLRAEFPDVAFLHCEVYQDAEAKGGPQAATPARIMDALGMTFEPTLWVASPDGVVVERLDFTFDAVEMRKAIALVA